MPTVLTHAVVPLAIGLGLGRRAIPPRLLVAGMAASMAPDLDVLAFRLGIPYADAMGHRGASHSLCAALLMGLMALAAARVLRAGRLVAFLFVAGSAASHGLLDMLTNGGHGVAWWWPLSSARLFLPWQVIEVSPLSWHRIASGHGLDVLWSEMRWVWAPAFVAALALRCSRGAWPRARLRHSRP